jgi:uncharacterized protein (DUF983 family)
MKMPVTVASQQDTRSLSQAVINGMLLRCPRCGKGHLFRAYLKVADSCDVCGQEFHHHKADDLPPYIAIVIVGHLIVGLLLELQHFAISPMTYMLTLIPASIVLPLLMLPSIKGAVVGMQWANRMHGFAQDTASDPATPKYP